MVDAISSLDPGLPLALFPTRLETRYLPRGNPTHLLVRIFPDVIHADAHHTELSAREADAGRHFWTSIWGQTDAAVVSEARRWLAGQTTPYRALWVAEATTPVNVDGILDPAQDEPEFPTVPIDERGRTGSSGTAARRVDGAVVRPRPGSRPHGGERTGRQQTGDGADAELRRHRRRPPEDR